MTGFWSFTSQTATWNCKVSLSALARDAGVAVKTRTQTTKSTSLGDPDALGSGNFCAPAGNPCQIQRGTGMETAGEQ